MNNNPLAAKRWIIIMLLLEDGVMEKCVTVSLRMTSIIMTPFYAIKEETFVTAHTKAEHTRNSRKGQMFLRMTLKKKRVECYASVNDIDKRRKGWKGKRKNSDNRKVHTKTSEGNKMQKKLL